MRATRRPCRRPRGEVGAGVSPESIQGGPALASHPKEVDQLITLATLLSTPLALAPTLPRATIAAITVSRAFIGQRAPTGHLAWIRATGRSEKDARKNRHFWTAAPVASDVAT